MTDREAIMPFKTSLPNKKELKKDSTFKQNKRLQIGIHVIVKYIAISNKCLSKALDNINLE